MEKFYLHLIFQNELILSEKRFLKFGRKLKYGVNIIKL